MTRQKHGLISNTPDYAGAIAYALHRLRTELSPNLTYHNLWHTQEDVIPAVVRLAKQINIKEDEQKLLEVAAAYHDTGFIYTYNEHELAGMKIAAEILPHYGFCQAKIACVNSMILATRLPQSPHNLLEEILADADLDGLGREDFFLRGEALRQERVIYERPIPPQEWFEMQLQFLTQHIYFTPAARAFRDSAKQKYMAELERLLSNYPNEIMNH